MSNSNAIVEGQYVSDKLNVNQKCYLKVKAILEHLKEVAPESKYTSELLKIDNSSDDSFTKLNKAVDEYLKFLNDMQKLACISARVNKKTIQRSEVGMDNVVQGTAFNVFNFIEKLGFITAEMNEYTIKFSDPRSKAYGVEIHADEAEHVGLSFDRLKLTCLNNNEMIKDTIKCSEVEAEKVRSADMTCVYNSMYEFRQGIMNIYDSYSQVSNPIKKKKKYNRQEENYDAQEENYDAQEENYDKRFEFFRTIPDIMIKGLARDYPLR